MILKQKEVFPSKKTTNKTQTKKTPNPNTNKNKTKIIFKNNKKTNKKTPQKLSPEGDKNNIKIYMYYFPKH